MGKKEANKGEEKGKKDCSAGKEDGPISVVLKIEMHCECCAQKVRRSVKGLKGVEAVASDISANKLTVIGKVNPIQLRGLVELKTHKNVELVSPAVAGKKEENPKGEGKGEKLEKGKDQKKAEDKKPKEPTVTTVVLKIRLHCHGCIRRIRKQASKIKGVDSVSIDEEKELVIVKGTMDVKSLADLLAAKLKKAVEIVNPKKDVALENEKGDKKKGNADGAKKANEGLVEAAKAASAAVPVASGSSATEASKMAMSVGGVGGGGDYPYRNETVHAPQLFSDENPNACSIM
ncbi:hypothetical protein KSP39_PZI008681 [Platanthera zijinensis]|uniref:HMA domain-containing protein n=1 Tax=Platanthera zijinensis TaxID=2320716 RepID=A0AAP0BMN7_9ASPA